jgi:hypothetical protein
MVAIFIETTIHIERLIAEPPLQAVIEANIQANQTFSSSYVWMEFHRTIGQDYAYLISLFRQQKPVTVLQLFRYIGADENLFSLRRLKRLLRIAAKSLEQIDNTNFDPFEVADLLQAERD